MHNLESVKSFFYSKYAIFFVILAKKENKEALASLPLK